jgi:hypothetical protein
MEVLAVHRNYICLFRVYELTTLTSNIFRLTTPCGIPASDGAPAFNRQHLPFTSAHHRSTAPPSLVVRRSYD